MNRMKQSWKTLGLVVIACLIAASFWLVGCGDDDDGDDNPGALPELKSGETWTQRGPNDGIEYTITYTVIEEDTINGKTAYVLEGVVDPPIMDVVDKMIMKLDKNTMFPLEMFSNFWV